MEEKVQILPVNPETFETQEYNSSDQELLTVSELDTAFSGSTDYIEIAIYDENQNKIYTTPEGENLTTFSVKEGDVLLSPQQDLERLGFDIDTYFINYNFYRKRLSSDSTQKYFISQISSDRTEIALDSNDIELDQIITSSAEFIQFREDATYFVDFYLNFGSNQSVIANNIKIDNEQVLIKLYEPLPVEFDVKSTLWVVEEISTPQAYQVTFPFTPEIPDDFTFISGPNFNLKVQGETGVTSQDFSYNTLIDSNVTSSVNQIQSLLAEKQININVNYEDFNQFIHFSSAKTRLENFYYKVGLIESASNQLSEFLDQITSDTSNTLAFSSSKAELTSQIDTIIKNFDGYEYFLYFNSGSQFSYPKSNTEPPFTLYSTGSTEVLNWIGSADPDSPYYGGVALSASDYDQDNKDWLYWAIPEYLRTDPDNLKYELFVDMVGQHYDNIWLYTKDITNKFDADNRLEYGISKDLVADAIKDFGIKLYSNNFNTNDLYTAFLGLTPSGSLFPFPEITGSLPSPTGYEYVDTRISASDEVIPLNDVNKRLYKRIYHNIPYLLKTKGTIAGLRALITSYGISDTILRVNEFGGKDRNNTQDWDLKQNVFNYAFDTGETATNYVSSSFNFNTNFPCPIPPEYCVVEFDYSLSENIISNSTPTPTPTSTPVPPTATPTSTPVPPTATPTPTPTSTPTPTPTGPPTEDDYIPVEGDPRFMAQITSAPYFDLVDATLASVTPPVTFGNLPSNRYQINLISDNLQYMIAGPSTQGSNPVISYDKGASWQPIPDVPQINKRWQYGSISPSGQVILLADSSLPEDIYISTDYGTSFIQKPISIDSVSGIATSAGGKYIYIAGQLQNQSQQYVPVIYRSADYGNSFQDITSEITGLRDSTYTIGVSGNGQNVSIIQAIDSGVLPSFYSTDYGETWTERTSLRANTQYVKKNQTGQYIMASSQVGTYGWYSTDYGATQIPLNSDKAYFLGINVTGEYSFFQPMSGNTLYINTDNLQTTPSQVTKPSGLLQLTSLVNMTTS